MLHIRGHVTSNSEHGKGNSELEFPAAKHTQLYKQVDGRKFIFGDFHYT